MLELADCGDVDSILDAKEAKDAKKKGLLEGLALATPQDRLKYPSYEINTNLPLSYQKNFVFIFYEQSFQPKTGVKFEEFLPNVKVIKPHHHQIDINSNESKSQASTTDKPEEKSKTNPTNDSTLFGEGEKKKKNKHSTSHQTNQTPTYN